MDSPRYPFCNGHREGEPTARPNGRYRIEELDLVAQVDTTLVVSAVERDLLAVEAPGADVRIVSNIHRV